MRATRSPSVICPTLIGRDGPLARLTDLLMQAHAGQGQVALIAGEAGIGKSRLVREVKAVATQAGLTVLQGRCFEQDRTFPYAPLVDLLRTFCIGRSPQALAHILGDTVAELINLMPDLASRLPGITATPPLEPEPEKRRLFRALTHFLQRVGAASGTEAGAALLVVLEDLHWCDDTSLEWLLYCVRHQGNRPLVLLLTYRDDEPPPSLHEFLVNLNRATAVDEITLTPLTRPDVDAMLRAIFQLTHSPRAEFTDTLYSLTEGNPFFIEEVLKSLIAAGDIYQVSGAWTRKPLSEFQIPRSIQVAVRQRTAHLSATAHHILTLAAVIGQRFDFALVQALTGAAESALLEPIKELIAAQLVVEESEETFAFRHALTRQAIYTSLLVRERKALHHQVADAIQHGYADTLDSRTGELAYHGYEAGLWGPALVWSIQAGDRAASLFAHTEALSHYDRARQCAERLAQPEQIARVDRAIGAVYFARGEFGPAIEAWQRALSTTPDPAQRASLMADLGAAYANSADEQAPTYLHAALSALDPHTQGKTVAQATLWLGYYYHLRGQYSQALGYLERVGQLLEGQDDRATRHFYYGFMAIALMYSARFEASMTWARRAIALGEATGDSRAVVLGYLYLAENAEYLGRWQDAHTFAQKGIEFARQSEWRHMEVWNAMERMMVWYYQGDLALARQATIEYTALANELGERRAVLHIARMSVMVETALGNEAAAYSLGVAAVDEGNKWVGVGMRCWNRLALADLHRQRAAWAEAIALYNQCAALLATSENRVIRMELDILQAEAYGAQGRLIEAESLLADALGRAQASGARHFEAVARRVQGAIYAAQGRLDDALVAYTIAIELCATLGSRLEWARALDERGAVYARRSDHAAAHADWTASRDLCQAMGAAALLWRVHANLGHLARAQQRTVEADREFAAARTIITNLLGAMQDPDCRQDLERRATACIPAVRRSSSRRLINAEYGGLTEREREVAALIAQGRSNRDIAELLFVSERTVTTHITSIFTKLGFTSRVQVATWASSRDLAPPAASE